MSSNPTQRSTQLSAAMLAMLFNSAVFARDADDLVLATHVNYMVEVVGRCETLSPGHRAQFDAMYGKARASLKLADITEATMKEAQNTPELNMTPIIAKFDAASEETRRVYCKQALLEVTQIANNPPPKKEAK